MHRGLGFLLDTMSSLLEHCSARLVMVGEARIRVELEAQAESLETADCVKFEGCDRERRSKTIDLQVAFVLYRQSNAKKRTQFCRINYSYYMHLGHPVVVTDCTNMEQIV